MKIVEGRNLPRQEAQLQDGSACCQLCANLDRLVVFGSVGVGGPALFGKEQHEESVAQMAIMQSHADAARDNAIAAKLNAQAVLNSERAWVEIKIGPPLQPDYRDEDQNISTGLFECSIQIENHGRTIAHVESVKVGADCVSESHPEDPWNGTTYYLRSILGSGQKETVSRFSADSFSDAQSILDGTKRGLLRITVKYRDVLETPHETSAVFVFQNSLEDPPEKVSSLSVYT
jgi:hypothetical protein